MQCLRFHFFFPLIIFWINISYSIFTYAILILIRIGFERLQIIEDEELQWHPCNLIRERLHICYFNNLMVIIHRVRSDSRLSIVVSAENRIIHERAGLHHESRCTVHDNHEFSSQSCFFVSFIVFYVIFTRFLIEALC